VIVLAPRPAAANQVGDLKAQAKAIEQKLVQEQLQTDAYQQQYSVDSGKVAADAQAVAQVGQQLALDQQRYNADTAQVRELAIASYMNGGQLTGADAALFEGNAEEVQSATEYNSIATGNIETALSQLQSAQDTLQNRQASLRQQQAKDQADETQQSTALNQATSTEHAMEAEQSLVTGRLDVQVAQRLRFGGPPDEFRTDVTFGLWPHDRWLVLMQSFNVISEGAGSWGYPSYAYYKLQLSAVYALTPALSLQLGGYTTYWGRNALQENGLVLGAWYKF
jgi:hypothetical protein